MWFNNNESLWKQILILLKKIYYYNYLVMLDIKKIEQAVNIIAAEKKIPKEKVVEIIEAALRTAYKKDYWKREEVVNVKINFKNYTLEINVEKIVVKKVTNPAFEISFEELWAEEWDFEEWDIVELDVTDEVMKNDGGESFWRIASQAARQVIIQKIWDSEKEKIYDLFEWKEGEIVNMKVNILEWWKVIFDYNWNQVMLPKSEQVSRDLYSAGSRFYLYIAQVSKSESWVPKIVLSRKSHELVPAIFRETVPEINEWLINIDAVVRQPWVKTKILVSSNYEEIDPVGTLIGQKWIRVKSVMEEISWEKIDIIPNNWDIREIIKKSLSPAEVLKVEVNEEEGIANAYIHPTERAKAVWRNGLNVNLASRLIWYKISIINIEVEEEEKEENE